MIRIRLFAVIPFLFCDAVSCLAQAQPDFRIEDRMSPAELESAGIDGLSGAELEALNQWLQSNMILQAQDKTEMPDIAVTGQSQDEESEVAASSPGEPTPARRYGQREEYQDVVSIIRGPFAGWDGNTVFRLENGQVYQQRRPGSWKTSLTDPEVRVTRSFLGMLELEVEGHSIGVKRLE